MTMPLYSVPSGIATLQPMTAAFPVVPHIHVRLRLRIRLQHHVLIRLYEVRHLQMGLAGLLTGTCSYNKHLFAGSLYISYACRLA